MSQVETAREAAEASVGFPFTPLADGYGGLAEACAATGRQRLHLARAAAAIRVGFSPFFTAVTAAGDPCHPTYPGAVAWSLTGALWLATRGIRHEDQAAAVALGFASLHQLQRWEDAASKDDVLDRVDRSLGALGEAAS